MNLPTDIANEALDKCGIEYTLGDIEDNTREAQVIARKYRPCLANLLEAAHWTFARKQQQMQLLADATGQTATVPTITPSPWIYEYALPNDCVRPIYVPWQANPYTVGAPPGNIVPPNSTLPLTGGQSTYMPGYFRPARFLVTRDVNFPPVPGSNWWEVQGQSPMGQTVILTNVPTAILVYTSLVLYPSEWTASFREAFVAYLASEIALPLNKDKKFGLAIRNLQMADAERRVNEARAINANEGWNNNSSFPDWINIRNSGAVWGAGLDTDAGLGGGYYYCGWGGFGSLGGSVF